MSCLDFRSFGVSAAACLLVLLGPSLPVPAQSVQDDSGLWKRHEVYRGQPCMTAVAADFTGDGQLDVICNAGSVTRLLVGPTWEAIVIDQTPDHNFIHSESWDVDQDGDQDYIAARYNPGLILWMENPGEAYRGTWKSHLIDDQVHGIHGLLRGDVDLDGRFDLLATSAQPLPPFPESLVWYRIPPEVHQAPRWQRYILADQDAPGLTHYLGLGDVNGDGRPDVATAAKGGPQDTSGQGEWFAWWEAPLEPTRPWRKHLIASEQPGATNIHPVDVNGDGTMDFIASRGHSHGVLWFEGPDWREHSIYDAIQEPHSLVVADIDADGDPDAASCAYGSQIAAWFENDGKGNFVVHIIGRGQEAYDIRAVDMDGDSDLDLLVAGRRSNNVVWYEQPSPQ